MGGEPNKQAWIWWGAFAGWILVLLGWVVVAVAIYRRCTA
jgi:heme O synthase-like polyprenyltransferase